MQIAVPNSVGLGLAAQVGSPSKVAASIVVLRSGKTAPFALQELLPKNRHDGQYFRMKSSFILVGTIGPKAFPQVLRMKVGLLQ